MKWRLSIPPASLAELPYLVVQYRAENLDTTSSDYLIYLDDHNNESFHPLRLCDVIADGQWHIAAVDLGALTRSESVHAVAVQVRAGDQGQARVWLDRLALTDAIPDDAELVERQTAAPPEPEWVAPLEEAEWETQPGWLGNPAMLERVDVDRREGATHFRVAEPGRGMKWLWELDEPVPLAGHRYVSLRYRARGVSPHGDYALCAMGKPRGETPGYTAIVASPELIADGRWHVFSGDLRNAASTVAVATGLSFQVQAEQPSATVEVADIRFTDSRQPSRLSDAFDWQAGASFAGFQSVPLGPVADGRSAQWKEHLRLDDWFGGSEVTVQGIPFTVLQEDLDLAATGIREKCELSVPVAANGPEVYLVLLAALVGSEEAPFGSGKFAAIYDVDRFRLRLEYADGTADECLPMNAATGRFGIVEGPQVLVAAVDSSKHLTSVVLYDRAKQAGFAVAAMSVRTQGPPGFPEVLQQTAPMKEQSSGAADRELMEVELSSDGPPLLNRLFHHPTEWSLLSEPCPLVQLTVDGQPIPPEDLQPAEPGGEALQCRWYQVRSCDGLRVGLKAAKAEADSLTLRACVENTGEKSYKVAIVAPSIGPYRLSEQPDAAHYLVPKRGAAFDNGACSYRELYSGLFPVQFLDTFSPADGRGLALRTEDTTCIRRYYLLEKNDDGFTLGVEYPEKELKPGETRTTAPSVVTLTRGDWHSGFDAYRMWLASWHQPLSPRKPWFREIFNFRQRFLWWLDPLYDQKTGEIHLQQAVDEARREFGGIDYLHLFDWGNCGSYGRIYGRTGDHSPYDYIEGGREALREAIAGVQAQGIPVGLYIEGYLLQQRGKLGQTFGKQWQLIGPGGKGRWWPESTEMFICPAVDAWREVQASTYETKVQELGVDGIYIDQFGFSHNKDCWSDEHGHPVPSYAVAGERDMTKLIRRQVAAVKENVAVYTEESPVDVTTQYQDGSFTYAMSTARRTETRVPLNLTRFAIPDFKTIEILYCDKPTGSWATGVRWVFFNGEAIWLEGPADEWFEPETRETIRRCYRILHKHRDAFTTLAPVPLVPTEMGGVFANAFPLEDKTVYTLYNTRHRTVRGEVLRLAAGPDATFYDEWHEEPARVRREGSESLIHLEIGPHGVGCVVVDEQTARSGTGPFFGR